MADINLERKEKKPIWPWIVGLLILLLLIWLLMELMDNDEPESVATGTAITEPVVTDTMEPLPVLDPAVQQYLTTCRVDDGAAAEEPGLEHEFSSNCLSLLADAMRAVAQQHPADPTIDQQLETVRQEADDLREVDPMAVEHANAVRDAAQATAEALGSMQQAFAGTNQQAQAAADSARQNAQQIQGDQPLLDQKDALMSFFRNAGDALEGMVTNSPAV